MLPERREELFPAVLKAALRVSVVVRCVRGIDARGLHVTNLEALANALERLSPGEGATCLVDGFSLRRCAVPHRAVVEGDGTSAAIAAASVVAKVTRDRYMRRIADEHPGWGFDEHVGYSTPEHRKAIEQIGISPLHRRSFQSVAYSQLELVG
jgi:ribonuclease HII